LRSAWRPCWRLATDRRRACPWLRVCQGAGGEFGPTDSLAKGLPPSRGPGRGSACIATAVPCHRGEASHFQREIPSERENRALPRYMRQNAALGDSAPIHLREG
jgi:hypothetical protein